MNWMGIWTTSLLSVLVICLQSHVIMADVQLEISNISKFPISINKPFQIKITSKNQSKLFDHDKDTMVIQITNASHLSIDKHVYDYGFKDTIDQELQSEYMRIPVWKINDSDHSITVNIMFTSKANSKTLQVYQISANSTKQRKEKLNNLTLAHLIHRDDIRLLILPKLSLSIQSEDGRKDEVQLGQLGVAKCISYGGVPPVMPVWKNANIFTVISTSNSTKANEIILQFHVSLLDHLKVLHCNAGETEESKKVFVLHPPSIITLHPDVDRFVDNGSTIYCTSDNGYPTAVISWSLIDGPTDSSRYFNVSQDGKLLHLTGNTPLGSKWTFNCTARNKLPGSVGIINRTVSFEVQHKKNNSSGFKMEYQMMISIPIIGSVILFCIVIAFSVSKSVRVGKPRVKSLPCSKNRGYDEATFDETASETCMTKNYYSPQCTLLRPQTSFKTEEIAKDRSRSLPFTPKLQFMLDYSGNPFIFLDQQDGIITSNDNNLIYPPQTFMPFYDPRSTIEDTEADDPLYSQIIGTLRPKIPQDQQLC